MPFRPQVLKSAKGQVLTYAALCAARRGGWISSISRKQTHANLTPAEGRARRALSGSSATRFTSMRRVWLRPCSGASLTCPAAGAPPWPRAAPAAAMLRRVGCGCEPVATSAASAAQPRARRAPGLAQPWGLHPQTPDARPSPALLQAPQVQAHALQLLVLVRRWRRPRQRAGQLWSY